MIRLAQRRTLAHFAVSIGLLCGARTLNAHPIHTTLTALSQDKSDVTLSVRAFADDFSASVATFAGRTPPTDWNVAEPDVTRYLASRLKFWDQHNKALTLSPCGVRRERELYWLCVRLSGVSTLRGIRMENRLLTERHEDQVNIVQIGVEGSRRTLLFTRKTDAQELAR